LSTTKQYTLSKKILLRQRICLSESDWECKWGSICKDKK